MHPHYCCNTATKAIKPLILLACLTLPQIALSDTPEQKNTEISETPSVQPRASNTTSIASLHIRAEDCATELREALDRKGLRVADNGPVDVILQFQLKPQRGWFTGFDLIDNFVRGFATKASYQAQLLGVNEQTLLTLHGEERALTGRELCQDIGDNLADRLKRN